MEHYYLINLVEYDLVHIVEDPYFSLLPVLLVFNYIK